jgi:hypothetical protein
MFDLHIRDDVLAFVEWAIDMSRISIQNVRFAMITETFNTKSKTG